MTEVREGRPEVCDKIESRPCEYIERVLLLLGSGGSGGVLARSSKKY